MEGAERDMGGKARVFLRNFHTIALQLIFPIECVGCGVEGVQMCERCYRHLDAFPQSVECFGCGRSWKACEACPRCRMEQTMPRALWAIGRYTHPGLRQAIHALKYDGRYPVAHPLGLLITQRIRRTPLIHGMASLDLPMAVVPVPLARAREYERGFNQAERIAKCVSEAMGWTLRSDLVLRSRATDPQARQHDDEARRANVSGAFCIAEGLGRHNAPLRVLVVDDVWTTGSTIREVVGVLKNAGVQEVYVAVVARG